MIANILFNKAVAIMATDYRIGQPDVLNDGLQYMAFILGPFDPFIVETIRKPTEFFRRKCLPNRVYRTSPSKVPLRVCYFVSKYSMLIHDCQVLY
jgi:hypothetical protein